MIASKDFYIPITEEEMAKIIRSGCWAEFALGTGDLIWRKGEPLPESVKYLAKLRGLNENMDGEGI